MVCIGTGMSGKRISRGNSQKKAAIETNEAGGRKYAYEPYGIVVLF